MSKGEELFAEDTTEVLNQLEENLLRIQPDVLNQDLFNMIFRELHTVKGSLYMFDRKELGDFTHKLESVFEEFNETQQPLSEELVQLSLNAVDFIRETLHTPELKSQEEKDLLAMLQEAISATTASIQHFADGDQQARKTITSIYSLQLQTKVPVSEGDGHPVHFIIRDLLDEAESVLHSVQKGKKITAWHLLFVSEMKEDELRALFLFVEDDLELKIECYPLEGVPVAQVLLQPFQAKLKTGKAAPLRNALKKYARELIQAAEIALAESNKMANPLPAQRPEKVTKASNGTNYIKVEQSKIDDLMNWVSELVTIQAALKNEAESSHSEALLHVSDSIHFISESLRDTIFSISLVPLKTLETRFSRLVRDLSQSLEKKVQFQSTGFETELDRKVITNLQDPLLHILRNCIDHGIEPPKKRTAQGKPATGTIHLNSYYSGNLVFIEIEDDGAGIDPEKIRKKAIEKGLIKKGDHMTDEEIIQLVFHPGFSTAAKVSDVSGRGVGMDVVRRKVMEMRGEVFITSEPGKGTKTTVKLPLSLSILEGLHTRVGETHLVMPMNTIREVHRFDRKTFDDRPKGSDILEFDGKQLSVVSIEEKYQIASSGSDTVDVITVNVGNHEKGVAVDEIKGQVQTVLKPLGDYYEKQDFILGGTILGDGKLAFVLDMEKLIN